MNEVREKMLKKFNPIDLDWMNYLIVDNDLTFHHIKKAELGGKCTINNGALLTTRAHQYLHMIERIDIEIYNRINKVFKEINDNKQSPTDIQREKIELLLLEFEIKNVDKIIKKKENLGKRRTLVAHQRRIDSQIGKKG